MNRPSLRQILAVVALVLAGAWPASGVPERPGDSAATPPSSASPMPRAPAAEPPKPAAGQAPPDVEDGVLKNSVHGFHFPIPSGWRLSSDSTSNEMTFTTRSCDECFLRILVTTPPVTEGANGKDTDSLEEAVQAIKEHIASERRSRLLGEEEIRVARKDAYTLIKEESVPPNAAKTPVAAKGSPVPEAVLKTRYVTFHNGGDRYFLVLKSPANRFPSDDTAFEALLAKFRFGS